MLQAEILGFSEICRVSEQAVSLLVACSGFSHEAEGAVIHLTHPRHRKRVVISSCYKGQGWEDLITRHTKPETLFPSTPTSTPTSTPV